MDLPPEHLKQATLSTIYKCESLLSVLRMDDDQLVTLRTTKSGQAEAVPLKEPKAAIPLETFPRFEIVPIHSLTSDEALSALGRIFGKTNFSSERASRAAKALSQKMTKKQRRDRAKKAVQARIAKKRSQEGT